MAKTTMKIWTDGHYIDEFNYIDDYGDMDDEETLYVFLYILVPHHIHIVIQHFLSWFLE